MGTDSVAELPRAVARARERFELWRRTRSERRIPEDLWALAAKLADSYGVHATAQALRLNPQSLREHMGDVAVVASAGAASRGFVELPSVGLGGWVIELSSPAGSRMRVEAPGGQALNLEALTRCFLGSAR